MRESRSGLVEEYLAKPEIHQKWEASYRTPGNEAFFELAFDHMMPMLTASAGSTILDAGCGICAHSIRLAKRGFRVRAVDISESILQAAEANVRAHGLDKNIEVQRENMLDFSFEDETFNYILCWGVLMHIPHVEKAISELARVLKSGGTIVISEVNMNALQPVILRTLKSILGRERAHVEQTPAGIEYWTMNEDGALLTRYANIQWLIEEFARHGLTLKKRMAGQFVEEYIGASSRLLTNLACGFNTCWFKYAKIPHPAVGNILILQKSVKQ